MFDFLQMNEVLRKFIDPVKSVIKASGREQINCVKGILIEAIKQFNFYQFASLVQ